MPFSLPKNRASSPRNLPLACVIALLFGLMAEFFGPSLSPALAAPPTISEFVIPTVNSQPFGIASGPDGNLWFVELNGHKIARITPTGTVSEFDIPTATSNPYSITSGPDGNLWFTEQRGNKIGRITPTGTVSEFDIPTATSDPYSITSGPDSNLWFTEVSGHKIGQITPSGTVSEFATPTAGSGPYGITSGPDGNIWFTEFIGNKIGKVSLVQSPTLSLAFGSPAVALGSPTSLTFTITNPNATAGNNFTGLSFSDTLPAGLAVATPNGLSGNCNGGTVTATAASTTVSLTGGSLAINTSCTIVVNVVGTASGSYSNLVSGAGSISSTQTGAGAASNTAPLKVYAPATATLALNPISIGLNASSTLSLTLANPNTFGGGSLSGVGTVINLPAGVVVATPNALNGNCNGGTVTATAGSGSLTLTGGSLAANANCVITVSLTGTTLGSKAIQASGPTSTEGGAGAVSNTATLLVTTSSTSLSLSPASVSTGQNVTLTATVSGNAATPTGTVTFTASPIGLNLPATPVTLVNGVATLSITPSSAGSYAITATYNGDSTYGSSASSSQTLTVTAATKLTPTVGLTLLPTSVSVGQNVTLSVVVSASGAIPTGTITFTSPTLNIPGGPVTLVNGVATLNITPAVAGSYSITATYNGDSTYGSSASTAQNLVVTPVPPLPPTGSYYHKLTPFRLYDSRPAGTNTPNPPLGTNAAAFKANETRTLVVNGLNGLPSTGIKAITANITIVSTGPGAGFLTAFPTTDSNGVALVRPVTSNLAWSNPNAASLLSNFATISVDSAGKFNVYVGVAPADVIIDVTGYYSSDATGTGTGIYRSLSSSQAIFRLYDSRAKGTNSVDQSLGAGEGSLVAGKRRTLQVTGNLGIPSTASAVVVNLTAVNLTGSAFLNLYPADAASAPVASLTFIPSSPSLVGNLALVPLSSDGKLVLAAGGLGSADAIMDVVGYVDTFFTAGSNLGLYTSLATPTRLLDTRAKGTNATDPPLGAGLGPQQGGSANVRNFVASGKAGIPTNAIALVAQVTLVDTTGPSFIGLYGGPSWPGTVAVASAAAGQLPGNLAIIPLDSAGSFNAIIGPNASNYILDVVGYIAGS